MGHTTRKNFLGGIPTLFFLFCITTFSFFAQQSQKPNELTFCSDSYPYSIDKKMQATDAIIGALKLEEPDFKKLDKDKIRILRITYRYIPYLWGETSLLIEWHQNGFVKITYLESDTPVESLIDDPEEFKLNFPKASADKQSGNITICRRNYETYDARVVALLEEIWDQMLSFTFYDYLGSVDAGEAYIELYDASGPVRRFSQYRGGRDPASCHLIFLGFFYLEQLTYAEAISGKENLWREWTTSIYQDFFREQPKGHIEPPLKTALKRMPTEKKVLKSIKKTTRKMKSSRKYISKFLNYNTDWFDLEYPHEPGQNSEFYIPASNDIDNSETKAQ